MTYGLGEGRWIDAYAYGYMDCFHIELGLRWGGSMVSGVEWSAVS
jgi:hypothetical protein